MKYVVGLDVGIASVGWAALELNMEDEPIRILDLGSRIFPKAETSKGESLAMPRRVARGTRRRLRRRRFRIFRVKQYLVNHGVLSKEELQHLYDTKITPFSDVYLLRYEGLTRPLTNIEWAKILIFMAKHRGFKSNRKSVKDTTGEDGDMLKAVQDNKKRLQAYHTVGEMLYKDTRFAEYKHNKDGAYGLTVSRDMLLQEIKMLFAIQRDFSCSFARESLEQEYITLFSAQRNFDEGPGGDSPYGGNQIEKMIGKCPFEENELRAPKASYAFMAFNLWQKINNLRIRDTGDYHGLSEEQRKCVAKLAWKKEKVTYKDIRKTLELSSETRFKDVPYKALHDVEIKGTESEEEAIQKAIETVEGKQSFSWVKAYHTMRKALDTVKKNRITELTREQLDAIGYVFSVYKNEASIRRELAARHIEEEDIEALLQHISSFTGFGHISIKACYKLLPYLEEGKVYSDACKAAGYDFQKTQQGKIEDIPNPVVQRAIRQTLKVLKAITRKYGHNPVEIHIELARELSKSKYERDILDKKMKENGKLNKEVIQALIKESHIASPTGQDIVKYKLYEAQQGLCAYSLEAFDIRRLFEPGYAEVDHIIPYSRSLDDSYNNKVLVLTAENRQKGNRTPLEYMASNPEKKKQFITWVQQFVKNPKKRDNLLKENFGEEQEKEWKERHLNDTRYISRFLYNYLRNRFTLDEGYTPRKRRIIPVNGGVTAYVRKRLGIPKIRENGDLHHAVDAVIIAAVTQGVINRVSQYSAIREIPGKMDPFPEPWPQFRKELEARVSEDADTAIKALHLPTYPEDKVVKTPFVSRMPRRKIHGQAHKETIKSPVLQNEGYVVSKVALQDLTLDKKTGEIDGYYNRDSDRLLYDALKQRLTAFGGKGKEAFKEPFYKPKADGTKGPLVKKVKIMDNATLPVPVNHGRGVAKNGERIRVDVFAVQEKGKKKYYLVPIYIPDTVKESLPNKAIVAGKKYEEWKEMNGEDFIFSLHKNDLLYVKRNKDISLTKITRNQRNPEALKASISTKEGYFYYQGCDISSASITIENNDSTYYQKSLGVQSLECFQKCVVDVLGNIHIVKKERRMKFR